MKIAVRPFQREDLAALQLQPAQAWMQPMVALDAYARQMEAAESFSAFADGACIAIGGLTVIWPGRAHASALISAAVGPVAMAYLHRVVARHLDVSIHRRIEATVDGEFKAGHRWLDLLGFRLETPGGMRGYMPDGGKSYLYARVQ